jgi:hypothetical protein
MVNHWTLLVAVHEQPAPPVTETFPVPPVEGTDPVSGAIVKAQPAPWVTVTRCPPIAAVPLRAGPDVADTASVIVPLPDCAAGPLTVIQDTSDAAVHAHVAPALMVTVRSPPSAPIASVRGSTTKLHP